MTPLFDGVKEFSKNDFEKNKEIFKKMKDFQNPHTFFIACSDSRINLHLMTQSQIGELFILRNIANIVPPYSASLDHVSTTSAIEYAVKVLDIKNIVVFGHSNCGGCAALSLSEKDLEKLPYTKKWLELALGAKTKAEARIKNADCQEDMACLIEKENIVEQMNHLLSYPFIEEACETGDVSIYGWYYDISSGSVYDYKYEGKVFEKIE
jgi:carbonic anhydrase